MLLESDIWRQVIKECGLNGSLDEVFHMIADVPTMLGQAVTLSSISDLGVFMKESAAVAQSMLEMVRTIETWLDNFLKESQTPRFWQIPSCVDSPADMGHSDKVFPWCFDFEGLGVANPVIMCWAVIAQLFSNVIQIHDLATVRLGCQIDLDALLARADIAVTISPQTFSTRTSWSIDEVNRDGSNMARYVCQSLEYFHRVDMGTFGSHATTYLRWSARQYFRLHPGYERERAWIENIDKMQGPGTRWGLTMMEFPDIVEPLSVFPKPAQHTMI